MVTKSREKQGTNLASGEIGKTKRKTNEHSLLAGSDDDGGDEDPFAQILADRALYQRCVLTMALQREPKGNQLDNDTNPPPSIISEGFYWKDYPPCEKILFDAMEHYYELSTQQRQVSFFHTNSNLTTLPVSFKVLLQ